MKNMIEQIAAEHKLDLNDSSQAIRALELLTEAVKAQRQEISVDLSTLNAQEFAEHFDYQFSKLNSFVEEDNELSDVAYQAIKIANARKKKLLEEEELLLEEVKTRQQRIKQIHSMLYASKSRVDVQTSTAQTSTAHATSVHSSLQDAVFSAEKRRASVINVFKYLDANEQQLTVKEIVDLIEEKHKQDDFKQSHAQCINNVSKEYNKKYYHVIKR